jgi:hypothetical protein
MSASLQSTGTVTYEEGSRRRPAGGTSTSTGSEGGRRGIKY